MSKTGRQATGNRQQARFFAASGEAVWGGCGTAGPRPDEIEFYRFDETGCPAWCVFHPPVDCRPFSDLLDSPTRRPCGPAAGRTCPACAANSGHDPKACGEQAGVIHRRPTRTPRVRFPPASSLDHSPPSSRNVDPTPSPSTGWAAVYERFFLRREDWLENLRCVWKGGGMFSEPDYRSAKR